MPNKKAVEEYLRTAPISASMKRALIANGVVKKPEPIKLSFDKTGSRWRIYATARGRSIAFGRYKAMGYKYFVQWKDVNGYGLEAVYRASWQNDSSPVSVQ